ncbi:MAG: ATP-binding protein [Opitutaceae bacterium]
MTNVSDNLAAIDGEHETAKIGNLMARFKDLQADTVSFAVDETILVEGTSNAYVYVIVSGTVNMLKQSKETAHNMQIDSFGPGDLIGLTSFWTKQASFLESKAQTAVTCLRFNAEDFRNLVNTDPILREAIHQLFISNLSGRYRRMISLNVKVAELSEKLENEHQQLKQAMAELQQTRNRLIHQEKLATLGQLIAGIAHEINNPCAALMQGVERLSNSVPRLLRLDSTPDNFELEAALLQSGIDCPYWSALETRARMEQITKAYPDLKRSLVRRLSQLNEATRTTIIKELDAKNTDRINQLLDCFEIGTALRSTRIASTRIRALVVSLKNYGKQDQEAWQMLDLRDGLRDTLTILNNRLRQYTLDLKLDPIEPTYCIGGEMNQVWTNLLVNASQATPDGGKITINTEQEGNEIVVSVTDSGTGIKEPLLEKIFEANFTTKKTKSDFGLGLGLAISKEIVEKHGGTITASNVPEGGARFTVRVPIEKS